LAEVLRPRDWTSGGRPLETTLWDSTVGHITIRAKYHDVESADTLVVIVHGLVGNADAGYCIVARPGRGGSRLLGGPHFAAWRRWKWDDINHPALTDDLKALLSMKCLRGYQRLFLLGYSFGGNMVLRAAAMAAFTSAYNPAGDMAVPVDKIVPLDTHFAQIGRHEFDWPVT